MLLMEATTYIHLLNQLVLQNVCFHQKLSISVVNDHKTVYIHDISKEVKDDHN